MDIALNITCTDCLYSSCPIVCNTNRWRCEDNLCALKDLDFSESIDYYLWFIVVIHSCVSTLGGIGGGPILIEILFLAKSMEPDVSIPIVITGIFGSSIPRLVYYINKGRDNLDKDNNMPIINYNMILLLAPIISNFSFIGTILNRIVPIWFITAFIALLLFIITIKLTKHGIKVMKKEKQGETDNFFPTKIGFLRQDIIPYLVIIILIYGLLALATYLREDQRRCSNKYILAYGLQFFFFSIFTISFGRYLTKTKDPDIVWTSKKISLFALAGIFVGVMGSFSGIGGGILLSPFFIANKIDPHVINATNSIGMFLSTFAASIQYFFQGKLPRNYALYIMLSCLIGSTIGQIIFNRMMKWHQKTYPYIFTVILLLGLSIAGFIYIGIDRSLSVGKLEGFGEFCNN